MATIIEEESGEELVSIFVPRRIKNNLKILTVEEGFDAMYQTIEKLQNFYEAKVKAIELQTAQNIKLMEWVNEITEQSVRRD